MIITRNDILNNSQTRLLNTGESFANKANGVNVGHSYAKYVAYFDGTGDYLTTTTNVSDFALTSTDEFSFECWLYPTNGAGRGIFATTPAAANSGTGMGLWINAAGKLAYLRSNGSGGWAVNSAVATDFVLNQWHFIQCFRNSSGVVKVIDNGTEVISVSDATAQSGFSSVGIGAFSDGTGTQGFMSDFRFRKGTGTGVQLSIPTAPLTKDANTKLYIPMDNPGMNFVDYALASKTFTVSGNTNVVSVSGHPYASTACYFDGNGDWLYHPYTSDFAWGSDDFTIEYWIRIDENPGGTKPIFGDCPDGSWYTTITSILVDRTIDFQVRTSSSGYQNVHPTPITLGSWNHVACVKSGTSIKIYLNGIGNTATTISSSTLMTASYNWMLGGMGDYTKNSAPTYATKGYISDFRISRGIARYTSNFTSPSTWLPNDQYVKCLMKFDNAGTTFTDSSSSQKAITRNGDVCISSSVITKTGTVSVVDTNKHPYASVVGYFDGTGDYLSTPDHADWQLGGGTGPFTIRFWMKVDSFTSYPNMFYQYTGPNGINFYMVAATDLRFYSYDGTNLIYLTVNPSAYFGGLGTWNHFELVRIDNQNLASSWLFFINGNQITTSLNSGAYNNPIPNRTEELRIGYALIGSMCDFEVSNIARHTSNFTPPIEPLIADANTKLLLPMNRLGTTFYDASSGNKTITTVADAKQVAIPPLSKALSFSSSYLTLPANSFNFGTKDFTIECWTKKTGGSYHVVFDCAAGAGTRQVFHWYSDNTLTFATFSAPFTMATGVWYHLAWTRSNGVSRVFVNGIQIGSNTTDTNNYSGENPTYIGCAYNQSQYLAGEITGMIVSKYAKWTKNFIPPNRI